MTDVETVKPADAATLRWAADYLLSAAVLWDEKASADLRTADARLRALADVLERETKEKHAEDCACTLCFLAWERARRA